MKTDLLDEFEIVQNNLVGAHALHEFVKSYTNEAAGTGPKLYWLFPVLPIVFNEDSIAAIHARSLSPGSFLKVINECGYLFINLQDRMEFFSANTFKCISIASDAGLFGYDPLSARVYLQKSTSIVANVKYLGDNYQLILLAAKRLGAWFAKTTESELLVYLNIKF